MRINICCGLPNRSLGIEQRNYFEVFNIFVFNSNTYIYIYVFSIISPVLFSKHFRFIILYGAQETIEKTEKLVESSTATRYNLQLFLVHDKTCVIVKPINIEKTLTFVFRYEQMSSKNNTSRLR